MPSPTTPASLLGYALFIVGAIVIMGVSLGTTHWIDESTNEATVSFGLFKICIQDKCEKYENFARQWYTKSSAELNVIQGLCISAVVFYASTLLIIGHLVFGQKMLVQSRNHGSACMAIAVLGAILALAGVGQFASEIHDDGDDTNYEWNFGYSYYLALASGVSCIMAGIFAFIGVGYLFNTQRPQGVVVQRETLQPAPFTQVVNPFVNYGHPMNPPQNPYLHTGATAGTQPVFTVNPSQAYMSAEKPPSYY